jgi:hypothetical protein
MRRRLALPVYLVLAALGFAGAAGAAPEGAGDHDALKRLAQLSLAEWLQVENGEIVVKTVGDHKEVAVVGISRIRASASCFVERFQDIEQFKKSPEVLHVAKLATPLEPDLSGFELDYADIVALRECRTGGCGVKLSQQLIEMFRREVNWSASDSVAVAQSLVRAEFFKYLESYLAAGNMALMQYDDKAEPVRIEAGFRSLLDARPGLRDFTPEFHSYLAAYPRETLAGVTDFLYWSRENFGVKPVTTITHAVIYRSPGKAVIASKQLYASHYFEASLGLTFVVDRRDSGSYPESYLLYLNRSKIDLLGGFLGGLRRAVLRPRLREGAKKNLAALARRLESECATERPTSIRSDQ